MNSKETKNKTKAKQRRKGELGHEGSNGRELVQPERESKREHERKGGSGYKKEVCVCVVVTKKRGKMR